MQFSSKKPQFQDLKNKWTARHRSLQNKLWDKHSQALNWLGKNVPGKQLAIGSLGGLMLLTTPASTALNNQQYLNSATIVAQEDQNTLLAKRLKEALPADVRPLTTIEEDQIGKILSDSFDFQVLAQLQGKKLNRSYGLIGGEQHLYRYPGDTLEAHAKNSQDWAMYGSSGIAPGLGAWGYFAHSQQDFTDRDEARERYYIAVQTFLSPGFAERVAEYRDFFKFRKMLLVNPKTGQSVVTVIGDAGPAQWTGKHLGGSPEVMEAVGLAKGPRKGPVLYFFIDDPDDKIPLGPLRAKNL
ncbi:MAG: hypothetical protein HYW45_01120 [Candidatus Daviesbacteria bacterium]|nr:MAG: hypothetical protein HYW45_01120 [Candidatus Daviesbacteria bacterium]